MFHGVIYITDIVRMLSMSALYCDKALTLNEVFIKATLLQALTCAGPIIDRHVACNETRVKGSKDKWRT